MPGSSNFKPWGGNTGPASDIQSDATYASDPTRSAGLVLNQTMLSALGNKLFLQVTMMVAALGQMMATKGYTVSDANLNTLAAALANIITQADLASSPALGGNPTAPTQAATDNTTKIATTAFAQAAMANGFVIGSGYIKFPAYLGGLIIQFGNVALAAGVQTLPFNINFPNACFAVFSCDGGNTPHATSAEIVDNTQFNAAGMFYTGGGWNYAITNYSWFAIGN